MNTRLRSGTIASAAVAVMLISGMPVLAQQSTTSSATTSEKAPDGSLQQYHGAFRASDLVGATVYNDQGSTVGKVNDLLLDTAGKADKVVISVGGFLGIGTKYVDVNFGQLQIQPSRGASASRPALATTQPSGGQSSTTTDAAATPGATVSPMAGADMSSQTKYYSLVMPGATKDSLTSMPEFKYSS